MFFIIEELNPFFLRCSCEIQMIIRRELRIQRKHRIGFNQVLLCALTNY